jgi:hypothetical protein
MRFGKPRRDGERLRGHSTADEPVQTDPLSIRDEDDTVARFAVVAERCTGQQPSAGPAYTVGHAVAAHGMACASLSHGVPRTPWRYGRRLQGMRAVTGSCRTRYTPHHTRAPCQALSPSTARGSGHGQHAQPVHWSPVSLTSWPPLGAVTMQRLGLPVPIQHHARAMAHHDHHAMREERHQCFHDDGHAIRPRAPRCFTGGGWSGWAAFSAP